MKVPFRLQNASNVFRLYHISFSSRFAVHTNLDILENGSLRNTKYSMAHKDRYCCDFSFSKSPVLASCFTKTDGYQSAEALSVWFLCKKK